MIDTKLLAQKMMSGGIRQTDSKKASKPAKKEDNWWDRYIYVRSNEVPINSKMNGHYLSEIQINIKNDPLQTERNGEKCLDVLNNVMHKKFGITFVPEEPLTYESKGVTYTIYRYTVVQDFEVLQRLPFVSAYSDAEGVQIVDLQRYVAHCNATVKWLCTELSSRKMTPTYFLSTEKTNIPCIQYPFGLFGVEGVS